MCLWKQQDVYSYCCFRAYIMKLCLLPCYKAHNLIMYKTMKTSIKYFLKIKTMQVGLVKKVLKQGGLTPNIPTKNDGSFPCHCCWQQWQQIFLCLCWLSFNRKLSSKLRNIVLFMDNAGCHPEDAVKDCFSNVKVIFLPPNTTSNCSRWISVWFKISSILFHFVLMLCLFSAWCLQ